MKKEGGWVGRDMGGGTRYTGLDFLGRSLPFSALTHAVSHIHIHSFKHTRIHPQMA